MSPKTLATAFEHCLYQRENHGELAPNQGPFPGSRLLDGDSRNINGEERIIQEDDKVEGTQISAKSGKAHVREQASTVPHLEEAKESPKGVLLMENNHVNLKV